MGLVRQVDLAVIETFNALARKSEAFDRLLAMFEENSLIKTGLVVGLLWYSWFSIRDRPDVRQRVIRTFLAALIGIILARAGQKWLPERVRPLHDPAVEFQVPYGIERTSHADWNSFPSDHALLLCALSAGLWTISRWFGIVSLAWSVFVVLAVRVYLGLHYPSDVLAGGLAGLAIMALVDRDRLVTPRVVNAALAMEARRPALFYAGAFLLTWQVADIFGYLRQILHTFASLAGGT